MIQQTISLIESLKKWRDSKTIDAKNLRDANDIVPVVFREHQGPYYLTFRDPQRGYTAKKRWYVDFIDNDIFQRLRTDEQSYYYHEDQWEKALNVGVRNWLFKFGFNKLRVYKQGRLTYLSLPRCKRGLETTDIEEILKSAVHWAWECD